ncbi:MAG TPA: head maturation protease, ClpP-related [Clostridia bacterium]|nr:head maturation protease, ClpP-related [Clostridia bacterium]
MSKFWNFINSGQDGNEVELRIAGRILDDEDAWLYEWFGIAHASPNSFRTELSKHKGKNIVVWIDSNGGDVFAGAGIYNALMEHKQKGGKVTSKVEKAMSAASVIAMAGDEIYISPVGMLMIHNPISYISGGWGEAKDFRHAAEVLDEVKETILNAYQAKTGKSRSKVSELMDNETYMSAKTAVKQGFADKILYSDDDGQSGVIENNFMLSRLSIINSMDDTKKKLFDFIQRASQAATNAPQPDANINKNMEGDDPMFKDVNELREKCPDLVKQVEDAAREEGKKLGAQEERSRIQNIEQISGNIDPELVKKAKFEEPMNAEKLAFEALKNDSAKGKEFLDNLKKDGTESKKEEVIPTVPKNDADGKTIVNMKGINPTMAAIATRFDARRRGVKNE